MIAKKSYDGFGELLPTIRTRANYFFRRADPQTKEEGIAEIVGLAFRMYRSLVDKDHSELAYAKVLCDYAVKQYISGRRVARTQGEVKQESERDAQTKSLDAGAPRWLDVILCDQRATPADIVQAKLDVGLWLSLLPENRRAIAKTLGSGETTTETARTYHLSHGRISQIRRELREDWEVFANGIE